MSGAARLSAMDLVVVGAALLAAVVLVASPFAVVPSFAAMYRDFGGELPLATELAIAPWPSPLLGMVVLAAAVFGVRRPELLSRRVALAASALGGWLAVGVLLYALYLPVFAIAGSIRAE